MILEASLIVEAWLKDLIRKERAFPDLHLERSWRGSRKVAKGTALFFPGAYTTYKVNLFKDLPSVPRGVIGKGSKSMLQKCLRREG